MLVGFFGFILDIIFAVAFGMLASKKGHSGGAYGILCFVFPLIGWIYVAGLPDEYVRSAISQVGLSSTTGEVSPGGVPYTGSGIASVPEAPKSEIAVAPVGSTVSFGSYFQGTDADAKTPISWKVLGHQGNQTLLVSEYALDCVPFSVASVGVTWDKSDARAWLNDIFLNTAFTFEEKNRIPVSKVIARRKSGTYGNPGEDTFDKVFLLDEYNIGTLLAENDRMCAATDYAASRGAWLSTETVNGKNACVWWTRSQGEAPGSALFIRADGSVGTEGTPVNRPDVCIRPAIWVKD